jgi:hypothetical protein
VTTSGSCEESYVFSNNANQYEPEMNGGRVESEGKLVKEGSGRTSTTISVFFWI